MLHEFESTAHTAQLWSSYKKSKATSCIHNDAMRILLLCVHRGGTASQMFVTAGVSAFKVLLKLYLRTVSYIQTKGALHG